MNYMEQVAHLLGVELEEEFSIKQAGTIIEGYYINRKGIYNKAFREEAQTLSGLLNDLLNGRFEIVKLPFKPKQDETYWYWGTNVRRAYTSTFDGESVDYASYKIGNCFRTKEEAETKGKELMESIKKEYEQ